MKSNICRPIILYNNFLPPKGEDFSWEYCAFGTFDGIDVMDAITEKGVKELLLGEWQHQNRVAMELKGKYSVQIIYGYCYKEPDKEKAFWASTFPYTFFSRVQVKWPYWKNKRESLEKILNSIEGICVNVYYALDNTDFIIVIKADSYGKGAGVVHSMHRVLPGIMNSHTVFALKQEWINQNKDDTNSEYGIDDLIQRIDLRIIEKSLEEKKDWKEDFEEQLHACEVDTETVKYCITSIIGTDDFMVTIYDITWRNFLKLYKTNGLLMNSGDLYKQKFAGVTTTIITTTGIYDSELERLIKVYGNENDVEPWDMGLKENIHQDIMEKCRNQINILREDKGELDFKELYMICNALPKYDEAVFSDFTFFAIIKPLRALLDLLTKWTIDDNYYEFIKSFLTYIQNSVKSDRHTMQTIDFNTRIYDIPTKICAFYTAYMYEVGDVLSNNTIEKPYDFMVVPGVTKIVNIKQVFRTVAEKRNLMRVEIPEKKFFDVEGMIVILTHEVAHYVGAELRSRTIRKEYVLKAMARGYVGYIKSCLQEDMGVEIAENDDELWGYCVQRTYVALRKLVDRNTKKKYMEEKLSKLNDDIRERIRKNSEESGDYFILLGQYIQEGFIDITKGLVEAIFGVVINYFEEKGINVRPNIVEYSERFITMVPGKTTMTTMYTMWEQVSRLYEECFADLISVLLLDLDINQYLDYMINESKTQKAKIEALYNTDSLLRITIVADIISKIKRNKDIIESQKNYSEHMKIARKMKGIVQNKEQNAGQELGMLINELDPNDYIKCCAYSIMYVRTYEDIIQYLLQCCQKYSERNIDSTMVQRIFNMFASLESNNIEDGIIGLEEMIYKYKVDLYQELTSNEDE